MRTCVFLCLFVCLYVLYSNPRLQQISRNVKVHELCINVTLIHVGYVYRKTLSLESRLAARHQICPFWHSWH